MSISFLRWRLSLTCFWLVVGVSVLRAQTPAGDAERKAKNKKLHETFNQAVDLKGIPDGATFEQVLRVLEKQLPVKTPIAIRVDADAFGLTNDAVNKSVMQFSPIVQTTPLRTALQMALSQVKGLERAEFVWDPLGTLTITSVERSLATQTYDLRDLLAVKALWLRDARTGAGVFRFVKDLNLLSLDEDDAAAVLVQALCRLVQPETWRAGRATVRVENGKRLSIHAAPSVHEEVANFLGSILRLTDVAVEMNAKLLELDAAQAAAFAAAPKVPVKAGDESWLMPLSKQQFAILNRCKIIGQSDPVKLRPNERSVFLSRQRAISYVKHPKILNESEQQGTILGGMSLLVAPEVSADRRFIQMAITQDYVRIALEKAKFPMLGERGETPVYDVPLVRKTSVSESITIADGQSFGFFVQEPFPGDVPAGRRWFILMSPTVYIEEEERLRKLPEKGANEAKLRRPIALALVDDGRRLIVTQAERGRVAIVDLATQTVVAEATFGRRFSDAWVSGDGGQIFATDEAAGEVVALSLQGEKFRETARRSVGMSPVSVWRSEEGRVISVALLWPRRVVLLDSTSLEAIKDGVIDLPFAPRRQIMIPGTGKLVVADAFGGQLAVIDLPTRKLERVRQLGVHNIGGLALDAMGKHLFLTHQFLSATAPTQKGEIQNGNTLSNNVRKLGLAGLLGSAAADGRDDEVYSIGDIDAGAGDPAGLIVDEGHTYVALAGVHELGIAKLDEVVWTRIPVGRQPTALALDRERKRVYVANTFGDSISIVDCRTNQQMAEIPLGSKAGVKLADLRPEERGEILFHDAKRSHEGWMSCHSCHPHGHTNGRLNDNLSDGSFGTPKRVLSLLGVSDTGPWAWNGKVADLDEQIRSSFRSTMQGGPATNAEVKDVIAYLATLKPPPPLTVARGIVDAKARPRGERLFAELKCATCHAPPTYTSAKSYDVGLDEGGRYNPPSLRGVSQGGPFMHDNRALGLNEVLQRVGHQLAEPLSANDLADLLQFLNGV